MLPFLLYIFFMFNVNVTLYEYIIIYTQFLRQVFPMILPFMYHEVLLCYNFPCVCVIPLVLFAGKYHITLRCVTKKYFSNE